MKKYRWACPHEWLADQYRFTRATDARDALLALARSLDHDTLQKVFEEEMSCDGYFDPIEEPIEHCE